MRRFILMTSCRTETETVSRMEKLDHSIVVADISKSCCLGDCYRIALPRSIRYRQRGLGFDFFID